MSCEVTVSKVRGERSVCGAEARPDRPIALSPIAQSADLFRWPAEENRVGFQAQETGRRGDHFDEQLSVYPHVPNS